MNDSEIILVHNETRLIVNKQKLISKSQYFETLLSSKFNDYLQNEHIINYDIPTDILTIFLNWVHDDDVIITDVGDECKPSLEIFFRQSNPLNVLKLLQLSVLFTANQLAEDLIYIIEGICLKPEYLLQVWLMALEFSFTVLSDIFFAECLDRFNELPIDELVALESKNLIKLITNRNIRSSMSYIWKVLMKWITNQGKLYELPLFKINPCVLNCIEFYDNSTNIYLYCWDKSHFYQYTTLKYPPSIIKSSQKLQGMQLTGQRYNLYMCGGIYNSDGRQFNTTIWRYSLISKKWFAETRMPVERFNMITVFLGEKLFLMGGVGRNQVELKSVDIYNRYTKCWTTGHPMPFSFSLIPEYCTNNNNLAVYISRNIYIYHAADDSWLYYCREEHYIRNTLLATEDDTCCIDINGMLPFKISLRKFVYEDKECCECICFKDEKWAVVNFYLTNLSEEFIIEGPCHMKPYSPEYTNIFNSHQNLLHRDSLTMHLHYYSIEQIVNIPTLYSSFESYTRKFFRIMDPAYLYSYETSQIFCEISH